MLVIALAHMLQTLLYVTNYFTQPGGLYLIIPVSLFRESLVIRLNDSDFQGKRQLFCPVERVWGTGEKKRKKKEKQHKFFSLYLELLRRANL